MVALRRIVSGGQTGVDRGALDAALAAGMPIGGWCPRGRRAEDGVIPEKYLLIETESANYRQRTWLNVQDCDGTLILNPSPDLTGGTALTRSFAERLGKPFLVIDLSAAENPKSVVEWLTSEEIETLNVAGPRESLQPGIEASAQIFMESVLAQSGVAMHP